MKADCKMQQQQPARSTAGRRKPGFAVNRSLYTQQIALFLHDLQRNLGAALPTPALLARATIMETSCFMASSSRLEYQCKVCQSLLTLRKETEMRCQQQQRSSTPTSVADVKPDTVAPCEDEEFKFAEPATPAHQPQQEQQEQPRPAIDAAAADAAARMAQWQALLAQYEEGTRAFAQHAGALVERLRAHQPASSRAIAQAHKLGQYVLEARNILLYAERCRLSVQAPSAESLRILEEAFCKVSRAGDALGATLRASLAANAAARARQVAMATPAALDVTAATPSGQAL